MKIGNAIVVWLMKESGEKFETLGVCIEEKGNPVVKIEHSSLANPLTIDLINDRIQSKDSGELEYIGEISGAVLVPRFLWKA